MPISRSTWTDDDGTGTLGTLIRNAELQTIYDNIDAAVWDAAQLANISATPQPRLFGTRNLKADVTGNTTLDITADFISFMKPSSPFVGLVLKKTGTTYTVNVSTAGPAANGRDQAGSFSASSWIYFYLIVKSSDNTVAGIASAVGPPTGPTLPTGYDEWVYVGAKRFNGSSQLVGSTGLGNKTDYDARQTLLTSGTAGGNTSLNTTLATLVPPTATEVKLQWEYTAAGDGGSAILKHISGSTYVTIRAAISGSPDTGDSFGTITMPLTTAQTIYYGMASTSGTPAISLWVLGYKEPNGAN